MHARVISLFLKLLIVIYSVFLANDYNDNRNPVNLNMYFDCSKILRLGRN
jgi:hypothetical protein